MGPGAGIFGFLINPPIVLYYIQGINTTAIHGHTALFGVYGFLAIALMLFSVRHIVKISSWSDKLLKWSFWGLNGGLMAMTVFSLIPSGFYQFYYAVKDGLWYARSPEITTSKTMQLFSWMAGIARSDFRDRRDYSFYFSGTGGLVFIFEEKEGLVSFQCCHCEAHFAKAES
jgi:nitric oxide reductase large subunit